MLICTGFYNSVHILQKKDIIYALLTIHTAIFRKFLSFVSRRVIMKNRWLYRDGGEKYGK